MRKSQKHCRGTAASESSGRREAHNLHQRLGKGRRAASLGRAACTPARAQPAMQPSALLHLVCALGEDEAPHVAGDEGLVTAVRLLVQEVGGGGLGGEGCKGGGG